MIGVRTVGQTVTRNRASVASLCVATVAQVFLICFAVLPAQGHVLEAYYRFESTTGFLVDEVGDSYMVTVGDVAPYARPFYPSGEPGAAFPHAIQIPNVAIAANRSAAALAGGTLEIQNLDNCCSAYEFLLNLDSLDECITVFGVEICPHAASEDRGSINLIECGNQSWPTGLEIDVGNDTYLASSVTIFDGAPDPAVYIRVWTQDLATGGPLESASHFVDCGGPIVLAGTRSSARAIGGFHGLLDELRLWRSNAQDDFFGTSEMLINHLAVAPFELGNPMHLPATINAKSGTAALVNDDGYPDLVLSDWEAGQLIVLLGNGDGSFQNGTPITEVSAPTETTVADLNADGLPDLVALTRNTDLVSILLGNGDGTFRPATTLSMGGEPHSLRIADLSADDVADLAFGNVTSEHISIVQGNGDGTFESPVAVSVPAGAQHFTVADLNGDMNIDLIAGGTATDVVSILLADGDGGFRPPATIAQSVGYENFPRLAAGDFNGDGLVDLVIGSDGYYYDNLELRLGNGDGTFQEAQATGLPDAASRVADLNLDGIDDLIGGSLGTAVVAFGSQSEPFAQRLTGFDPFLGRQPAVADYNGDGAPDIVRLLGATLQLRLIPQIPSDFDDDGVSDYRDNCWLRANSDQRDTDNDGIGNACDPDVSPANSDCVVNALDLGVMHQNYFIPGNLDTDFDGDGITNAVDLGIMKQFFFKAPGYSWLTNSCAGPSGLPAN